VRYIYIYIEHFFLSNDSTKHTVCYNIVTGTVIVASGDFVARQFRAFRRHLQKSRRRDLTVLLNGAQFRDNESNFVETVYGEISLLEALF